MKRSSKVDFNKKVLIDNLKLLHKEDIAKLMAETFTKTDMLDAIDFIYSKANLTTNDNIEKYFYRRIVKLDTVENTL
jgi:hypothetical protein